ncbi:MAG: 2-C-methyl-D-erythritol 4-phosphate cytidylyltransferase [Rhodospirillaceae bacterium]|nr:2-C-methyl-D-erythritol 4-phosphate cytidylyltransferase [Rhodospirillaceae bacterium]
MTVQALIQAAGSGSRLGLGAKAFVDLGGQTLLERAVALFRDVADKVLVAVPAAEIDKARKLVGHAGVAFIAGGSSRSETTQKLIAEASAPWLILHDVVHPFATPALVKAVLEAAYAHGASAPGFVNTEFLYTRDGDLLHAPGDLLIGQKPIAFSRDAVLGAYRAWRATGDPSLLKILESAGLRTKFVDSSAHNIKITHPADLELARAILALRKEGKAETGEEAAGVSRSLG